MSVVREFDIDEWHFTVTEDQYRGVELHPDSGDGRAWMEFQIDSVDEAENQAALFIERRNAEPYRREQRTIVDP